VWWICQSLEISLEGYLLFARHVKCSPYHPETNAETEIGLDQKIVFGPQFGAGNWAQKLRMVL